MRAFSQSPIAIAKQISNTITSIKQALDVEHPIQLSEWKRLAPNQMQAVLIKFIEGTLIYFSFPKDSMPNAQIVMIVNGIMEKYFYFRLEDVCLCFKKGRLDSNYRKFYGRVDGSVFLEWFAKYDKEREEVLQSHPSNNQAVSDITQGVPWEEYRDDLIKRAESGDTKASEALSKMESVMKMFDADKGTLYCYRYNMKHRFDNR